MVRFWNPHFRFLSSMLNGRFLQALSNIFGNNKDVRLLFQASFNPSESGEVGASYGSTPGPSSAVGAGGASGAEAATKEDDSSAASDDYPKILLMGLRRSGKSSITKV